MLWVRAADLAAYENGDCDVDCVTLPALPTVFPSWLLSTSPWIKME